MLFRSLDHASPNALFGGKLGVDCTGGVIDAPSKTILSDRELLLKVTTLVPEVKALKQYKTQTKTPITVMTIDKKRAGKEVYEALKPLKEHMKLLIVVDCVGNDVENAYMLIWRVVNNIDALRDIFVEDEFIGIDATTKNDLDGYTREWPKDTDCDQQTIKHLIELGLVENNPEFLKHFHI